MATNNVRTVERLVLDLSALAASAVQVLYNALQQPLGTPYDAVVKSTSGAFASLARSVRALESDVYGGGGGETSGSSASSAAKLIEIDSGLSDAFGELGICDATLASIRRAIVVDALHERVALCGNSVAWRARQWFAIKSRSSGGKVNAYDWFVAKPSGVYDMRVYGETHEQRCGAFETLVRQLVVQRADREQPVHVITNVKRPSSWTLVHAGWTYRVRVTLTSHQTLEDVLADDEAFDVDAARTAMHCVKAFRLAVSSLA